MYELGSDRTCFVLFFYLKFNRSQIASELTNGNPELVFRVTIVDRCRGAIRWKSCPLLSRGDIREGTRSVTPSDFRFNSETAGTSGHKQNISLI